MTATPSAASTRRHLNGEHNRWCQKIKGNSVFCRFTGQLIKQVRSR